MKKYLENIQNKTAHERRGHAMQWATGLTALAVVVWVSTLGLRFATQPASLNTDSTQVASVVESQQGNATLLVATSSNSF